MKIVQQLLTMNNRTGEIIEVKNKKVTVFYSKDNSTEVFKSHQFDSVEYMIKRYYAKYGG